MTPTGPAWIPYCGAAPDPATWLVRWNTDPRLILGLLALLVFSLWRLQGEKRACAIAATAVAAAVFVSPLCALSSALFTARTVHHLSLIAVVAPLAAAAWPSAGGRSPFAATTLQAVLFWAWHAPAAYSWALGDDAAYWLMQLTMLGSAIWFWRELRAASALAAVGALLIAMVAMGLLGAILTFAPQPLYAPHLASAEAWGVGPLRDQQTAGLIMWAPASAFYLAIALRRLAAELGEKTASA